MNSYHLTSYKGKEYDPFKDIDIKIIARGLSRTGRFAGQGCDFYSVAQHSVLLSEIMIKESYTLKTSLCALMHDAPDFILGDIPSPVRKHPKLIHYNGLYEQMLHTIMHSYGIEGVEKRLKLIHPFDKKFAVTEAKFLLIDITNWNNNPEYDVKPYKWLAVIPTWTFKFAGQKFLQRFDYLMEEILYWKGKENG